MPQLVHSLEPAGCDPYVLPRRPWLALYNVRLLPKLPTTPDVDLALIQQLLPDELMLLVLSHVGAYSLGRVACTCRAWRILSEHPKLWQQACMEALSPVRDLTRDQLHKLLLSKYRGSWKRMFVLHPHVRYDGLYISRNTYVRTGTAELQTRKTVHLVAWFRYFRFFPDGTLMYRTSPNVPSKVARVLRQKPKGAPRRDENLYVGRYCVKDDKVMCVVVYPNSQSTEVRTRLSLRSTHPGANNRMDVHSIVSYDRELGTSSDLSGASSDPEADLEALPEGAAGAAREYRRGLAPLVFVPWEQVATTALNLPAEQMDFFVAG